jgi:DNA modification methylase
MIEMWDDIFTDLNQEIGKNLKQGSPMEVFSLMHEELDKVWKECYRVLKPGGILCVNIGDATRTVDSDFQLFSNHSQIVNRCVGHGFVNLPNIIWRKPTNSPTKFMGSGMLPPGAYVTLEHEYILNFRKGAKRHFSTAAEKQRRRESAIFWEERNKWFSDIWMDLTGTRQQMKKGAARARSAAFPLELAYRLVNMFSIIDDTILDPFMGTGTTNIVSMLSARNSIGIDINSDFNEILKQEVNNLVFLSNEKLKSRLGEHENFVEKRESAGKTVRYTNKNFDIPVVSKQEREILFYEVRSYEVKGDMIIVEYAKYLEDET